jgi:hypothetical protein
MNQMRSPSLSERVASPQVITGDGMILRHILLREPQEAAP